MLKVASYCEDDTFNTGVEIGKRLKKGGVVALYGELGSGKTTLAKGIASAFGIKGVVSPTFTLLNEYYGEDINIYHFDAYRIDEDGWIDSGFDEYLYSDGICIIEWADNIKNILPENTVSVTFSRNVGYGDDYRDITVGGEGF
ncbi:MAG: tRNA threonylcarbamoyladenosine biosynthesis protein TsaE [Firmicutes bacterium ADurb.Bin193]|nr:MAG: tRNA threonylcarbamoyladenosine biosynthesis protein TsaE [Firmicutes bacterium ADurb.Bin193]